MQYDLYDLVSSKNHDALCLDLLARYNYYSMHDHQSYGWNDRCCKCTWEIWPICTCRIKERCRFLLVGVYGERPAAMRWIYFPVVACCCWKPDPGDDCLTTILARRGNLYQQYGDFTSILSKSISMETLSLVFVTSSAWNSGVIFSVLVFPGIWLKSKEPLEDVKYFR